MVCIFNQAHSGDILMCIFTQAHIWRVFSLRPTFWCAFPLRPTRVMIKGVDLGYLDTGASAVKNQLL